MANRQIIVPAANILRLPFFVHRKTQSNEIEQNTNVQKQEPNQTKQNQSTTNKKYNSPSQKKNTQKQRRRERKNALKHNVRRVGFGVLRAFD